MAGRVKPKEQPQKTVVVKDYGDDAINRLAVVLKAMEAMTAWERGATLGLLKSKYDAEWPRDPSY